MEKKMNRIQRWLDRCVTACKSGAWGSALMEVECLEAGLKSAREEIWAKAMIAPSVRKPTFRVFYVICFVFNCYSCAPIRFGVASFSRIGKKRWFL